MYIRWIGEIQRKFLGSALSESERRYATIFICSPEANVSVPEVACNPAQRLCRTAVIRSVITDAPPAPAGTESTTVKSMFAEPEFGSGRFAALPLLNFAIVTDGGATMYAFKLKINGSDTSGVRGNM